MKKKTPHRLIHPEVTLSSLQHQVIELLVQGHTVTSAAARCGVHRTTIHHWQRANPDFIEAVQHAREERADHFRHASEEHAEASLKAVREMIDNPKTPPSVRLKAALHMLNQVSKAPAAPSEKELARREARRAEIQQQEQPPVLTVVSLADCKDDAEADTRVVENEQAWQSYRDGIEAHLAACDEFEEACDARARANTRRPIHSSDFITSTRIDKVKCAAIAA